MTACCVVFQFTPEVSEGEVLNKVPPYYDKLNSWLGQILQLDASQVIYNPNAAFFAIYFVF